MNLPLGCTQEERISGLQAATEKAASSWAAAEAEAAAANLALAAERSRADALQRQLGSVSAERKELGARLAAAQIEAAGHVQVREWVWIGLVCKCGQYVTDHHDPINPPFNVLLL